MTTHNNRLLLAGAALALFAVGCKPKGPEKFDADAKSGPDARRPGAKVLLINTPTTDEVSFKNQDKTDWFMVELKGKPGYLDARVNWDVDSSDLMIDVFDEFGKQLSASPPRRKQEKEKTLLTQIEKPGVYYVRITAPTDKDGTVYTLETKWNEPKPEPIAVIQPEPDPPPQHHVKKPDKPAAPTETIEAQVLSAYREGEGLVLQINKGSGNGVKVGMTGSVLVSGGDDHLDGGDFKVFQVVSPGKSLARCPLKSLGKNTRVLVNVK